MNMSEVEVLSRQPGMSVDLAAVGEAVSRGMAGEVPRERIDGLLRDLLDTEFQGVRVLAYVPIFLQRMAQDRLRAELRLQQSH
jgi:hypothetical protein